MTEGMMKQGTGNAAIDLLRVPLVGRILLWRHARTVVQSLTLFVAALVIYDGLFGPQLAPKNLAGVLPWVHWRGLIVLAILVAGNLFCMACPFMLTRNLVKRFRLGNRPWPKRFSNKWLSVFLLLLFFWAYEAFDLWASPWLTAWLALAYFAAAFVVDAYFRGAAFCKYLCPIGQFHFVNSLNSPLEVRARSLSTCASCSTKDCLNGGRDAASGVRGCELWLFQQRKLGNMDCTFCLDCARACPHDNVGVSSRMPTAELWGDSLRAGVGRFRDRLDLTALVALIVFAAFANAFGMVGPVYAFESWLAGLLQTQSEPLVLIVMFALLLGVAPAALIALTAYVSRLLSGAARTVSQTAKAYVYALVPVGFGMWLAHYAYHFLIGALTVIPVLQSFFSDFGFPVLGVPTWGLGPIVPGSWLLPIELALLEVGLLGSLVTAYRIAADVEIDRASAWRGFVPWATLAVLLWGVGVWLLLQPMEMRGTFGVG